MGLIELQRRMQAAITTDAEPPPLLGEGAAEHRDVAGEHRHHPEHGAQQRALAGAIGTDDRHQRPAVELQLHVPQHRSVVVRHA